MTVAFHGSTQNRCHYLTPEESKIQSGQRTHFTVCKYPTPKMHLLLSLMCQAISMSISCLVSTQLLSYLLHTLHLHCICTCPKAAQPFVHGQHRQQPVMGMFHSTKMQRQHPIYGILHSCSCCYHVVVQQTIDLSSAEQCRSSTRTCINSQLPLQAASTAMDSPASDCRVVQLTEKSCKIPNCKLTL